MGVKRCFAVLAVAFACLASGYGDSEQDAVVLCEEVDRCAQAMGAAESYRNALSAYEKAVEAGEHIFSEYPASDVAEALLSGERKVGGLSWDQFLELKAPLELSAEAEQDLTACALVVAETGDDESYKRNVLLNLAECYAGNETYPEAEDLLESMLEYVPSETNVFSRAHIITRCAEVYHKIGDDERAASLRERAAEEWASVVVTSEWDSDRLIFGYMDLTIASFVAGEEEAGERLLARTLQLVGEPEDFLRQRELYDIATSLAQVGYVDKALSIVQEMMREPYDSILLSELMEGKYDDDQLAQLLTFAVALKEGLDRDGVLAELAVHYAERGQLTQAVSIIRTWMSESYREDQTWGRIAEQCVKLGKFNNAASCAGQIKEGREKAVVLAGIAVVCEEAGERELANEMYLWAEECIAAEEPGSYFQISACCAVAEKYIDGGMDVRAAALLSKAAITVGALRNLKYRSWGQSATIARLLFRIDQDEFARELLSLSERWADEVDDELRLANFMRNIADAYAQAGELKAALNALDTIEINGWETATVLRYYAEYFRDSDDVSLFLESMVSCEDKTAIRNMLLMLTQQGDVDLMLRLIEALEDSRDRKYVLDEAVDACVKNGLFSKAIEAAVIHENPLDQAGSLVGIAARASAAEYVFAQDDLAVLSRILQRAVPMDVFWEKQGFRTSFD